MTEGGYHCLELEERSVWSRVCQVARIAEIRTDGSEDINNDTMSFEPSMILCVYNGTRIPFLVFYRELCSCTPAAITST